MRRLLGLLAVGGLILATPTLVPADETTPVTGIPMTVPPSGTATWAEIVAADEVAPKAPDPQVIPRPEGPGPREIGGAAPLPERGPSAPWTSRTGSEIAKASLTTSFAALGDNNTSIPPDTMGAAGPSHLMTMLNTQVRIQDKTGGTISTVSLSGFWNTTCGLTGNPFDPHVRYDHLIGKWIATVDADGASATSQVFFAVSSSSDPTAAWTCYSFVADPGGTFPGDVAGDYWADFPGLGFNSTWIAITNNMFTVAGPPFSFNAVKMWVIDKTTLGGILTVTVFPEGFDTAGGASGFTVKPALTFAAAEPKLYLMDNSGFNTGPGTPFLLRMSEITGTGAAPGWSVTAGSAFAGTGLFPVANNFSFSMTDAPQLGTVAEIDTGSPRMQKVVFRNGKIWCVHGAASLAGGQSAVYWYELDPATMVSSGAPIVQSGVVDGGAGVHHSYPSISVNSADEVCVGFSRTDSSRFIEAVVTGRVSTDAPGAMDPITVLKAGEDSYVKDFGGPSVRWGDYSATSVDPSDDLTFWTIQEYAALDVGPGASDDRWGTWWGKKEPADLVPTTSEWGLIVMAVALLAAITIVLARQRRTVRVEQDFGID